MWGNICHKRERSVKIKSAKRDLSFLQTFPFLSKYFLILTTCLTPPQTTNLRLFQTERVCRRQKRKKHCGKRRNCLLRAISHLATVFLKSLYCRHIKQEGHDGTLSLHWLILGYLFKT